MRTYIFSRFLNVKHGGSNIPPCVMNVKKSERTLLNVKTEYLKRRLVIRKINVYEFLVRKCSVAIQISVYKMISDKNTCISETLVNFKRFSYRSSCALADG